MIHDLTYFELPYEIVVLMALSRIESLDETAQMQIHKLYM